MQHKQIQVFVSGRVQGVGFRHYTQSLALKLGVFGFVRNLNDGRVEVVASGPGELVDALLEWIDAGSPGSTVEACHSEVARVGEVFNTFSIRY